MSSIQKNSSNRLRLLQMAPRKKTKHNGVSVARQDGTMERFPTGKVNPLRLGQEQKLRICSTSVNVYM